MHKKHQFQLYITINESITVTFIIFEGNKFRKWFSGCDSRMQVEAVPSLEMFDTKLKSVGLEQQHSSPI